MLRAGHRLRLSEEFVCRGIFGSRREEETRHWRVFHSGFLQDFYRLSNIVECAEINENEINRARNRNGKYEKLVQRFVRKRQ